MIGRLSLSARAREAKEWRGSLKAWTEIFVCLDTTRAMKESCPQKPPSWVSLSNWTACVMMGTAMAYDVESHLGAVERSVSTLERDGQAACAVTLSRSFATSVEDLWDAVTNLQRIPRWFLPIKGKLEPGGRYGSVHELSNRKLSNT